MVTTWIYWLVIPLIFISLLLIGFNMLLKRLVDKRTAALIQSHEQLRLSAEAILESSQQIEQDESDIQTLVETMLKITGELFFDHIVVELCRWLGCSCAIVGEIINGNRVKAIAMVMDGEPVSDYSYSLAGTPCEEAINKGYCAYPENVCVAFPDDLDLLKMNAVGYVGVPLKNRSGEAIGILCCISRHKLNLTKRTKEVMNIIAAKISGEIEREKAEKERYELQQRLRQAYKMESIGTLAGGIAHDFNNILIPILGYTEMLLDTTPEDSTLYDNLNEIRKAAFRAKDLIKQILTFSRQSNSEMALIKIQPIVKEVLKLMRASIPAMIEIEQDISPNCGLVNCEPTQIHQIVMNLVTNSFHAMEDTGGELKVTLEEVEIGKDDQEVVQSDVDSDRIGSLINYKDTLEYKMLDLKAGSYACLTVADNGIGMGKDVIARAFDPFFTTKDVGRGTGMGLSVVHGIVKSINGAIKVYSKAGYGTVFRIYLPVISSISEVEDLDTIEPVKGGDESILIVDDEYSIVETEKSMLEYLGYKVTAAESSINALEIFTQEPYKFDVVITDLSMPKMSGDQLAIELLKVRSDIPIIMCTGFIGKISMERAESIGIYAVLPKPVSIKELSDKIREALKKG
ncbi:MAG: response regulator [Desulfamplus sp.]|nr:response regulator [Desulfamplus sp.]